MSELRFWNGRSDHDALSPSERAILDLSDAGFSKEEIVRRLGFQMPFVRKTVNMFANGPDDRFDRMVVAGSRALLSAMLRTGQVAR